MTAEKSPKTVVTMTITGVPMNVNNEPLLADAVMTVDFAQIACECLSGAAFSVKRKATRLGGSIVVKATNIRKRT